jgi:hypothetical protein
VPWAASQISKEIFIIDKQRSLSGFKVYGNSRNYKKNTAIIQFLGFWLGLTPDWFAMI